MWAKGDAARESPRPQCGPTGERAGWTQARGESLEQDRPGQKDHQPPSDRGGKVRLEGLFPRLGAQGRKRPEGENGLRDRQQGRGAGSAAPAWLSSLPFVSPLPPTTLKVTTQLKDHRRSVEVGGCATEKRAVLWLP